MVLPQEAGGIAKANGSYAPTEVEKDAAIEVARESRPHARRPVNREGQLASRGRVQGVDLNPGGRRVQEMLAAGIGMELMR